MCASKKQVPRAKWPHLDVPVYSQCASGEGQTLTKEAFMGRVGGVVPGKSRNFHQICSARKIQFKPEIKCLLILSACQI